MPITTKDVSSNPARGTPCKSMSKFVIDFRQGDGFLWAYRRDIADIF